MESGAVEPRQGPCFKVIGVCATGAVIFRESGVLAGPLFKVVEVCARRGEAIFLESGPRGCRGLPATSVHLDECCRMARAAPEQGLSRARCVHDLDKPLDDTVQNGRRALDCAPKATTVDDFVEGRDGPMFWRRWAGLVLPRPARQPWDASTQRSPAPRNEVLARNEVPARNEVLASE